MQMRLASNQSGLPARGKNRNKILEPGGPAFSCTGKAGQAGGEGGGHLGMAVDGAGLACVCVDVTFILLSSVRNALFISGVFSDGDTACHCRGEAHSAACFSMACRWGVGLMEPPKCGPGAYRNK